MARDRVFGAVSGPGTQVRVKGAPERIQDSELGHAVIIGEFRSGPVGQLLSLPGGSEQYLGRFGRPGVFALAGMQAEDFYQLAQGAGQLHVLRTGGAMDGERARRTLYDRNPDTSVHHRSPHHPCSVVGEIRTDDRGRFGGREQVAMGSLAASAITWETSSRVKIGTIPGFGTRRWAGATFYVFDPGTNEVWSARVLAADADDPQALELDSPAPASVQALAVGWWYLGLTATDDATQAEEAVEVLIGDDPQRPGSHFTIVGFRDGVPFTPTYTGLQLSDQGGAGWWEGIGIPTDLVSGDGAPLQTVDRFAGDRGNELSRPAAYAELVRAVNGSVVTFQTVRWERNAAGTGDAYLETDLDWQDPAEQALREITLVCTFTSPTVFTVETVHPDGQRFRHFPAGNGTLGAAWNDDGSGNALIAFLPRFTLRAGPNAMAPGDEIVITYRPIPQDLLQRDPYLHVAAGPSYGDVLQRYRVRAHTASTVTVVGEPSALSPVTAPLVEADTAGPFNLAGGETLIVTVGGETITLTQTQVGAAVTTADLAAELNALELARAGSAEAKLLDFGVSAADKLTGQALRDFGPDATIAIGNGTINGIVGLTDGQTEAGGAGDVARLEFRMPLVGGEDPEPMTEAEWLELFDTSTCPLNELEDKPVGTVAIYLDRNAIGHLSASAEDAVLRALVTYAYTKNMIVLVDAPEDRQTEASAIAWHRAAFAGLGDALEHHRWFWPALGYKRGIAGLPGVDSVQGSMLGAVLGLRARFAHQNRGYHVPYAGTEARLDPAWPALPHWANRRLNTELLGGYGCNPIRRRGAATIVWGNRMTAPGVVQASRRETDIHVQRTLLVGSDALVFKVINDLALAGARQTVTDLFTPWWRDGWFDDLDGPTFEDQITIVADRSNNGQLQREVGELHVAVTFNPASAGERVVYTVGPKGVKVSS